MSLGRDELTDAILEITRGFESSSEEAKELENTIRDLVDIVAEFHPPEPSFTFMEYAALMLAFLIALIFCIVTAP